MSDPQKKNARRDAAKTFPGTPSNSSSEHLQPLFLSAWFLPLLMLVLAAYLFYFFQTPLLTVPSEDGSSIALSRGRMFLDQLVLPDQTISDWFDGNRMPTGGFDRLLPLGAILVWTGLAWWIGGAMVLPCTIARKGWGMDRHGLAIVAGMQVLSLETFLLGWFGWISTRWPLVLVLLASILVATFLRQRFRDPTRSTLFDTRWSMNSPSRDLQSISSAARRSIGFFCLSATLLGLLILLGGILPPIEFDVREYHLQAPKEFFQNGRIAFVEHNIYANMPLGAEMHALAWMVLLGGPNDWFLGAIIGKGVIAMFAVFGAMVVGGTAYRAVGPVGGWVAAVSFLGCPGIAEISRHGLVDVVVACYGLCGFVVLWHVWVQMKAKGILDQADSFLVGWFLGGAAACKYTAYPMLVVPGLLLFLYAILLAHGSNEMRARLQRVVSLKRELLMLMLGCLLGCGGWLLKNSVEAHNPFYPLLGSWMGGKTLTPEKVAQWNRAHQVPRAGSPSEDSPDYGIRSLFDAMVEMGLTSRFLCLMLAPLAILGMVVYYRRTWLILYPMIWIFVVWWGMTHRLDRFWLPLLPFAALAAGMGGHWLVQQWRGVPLFALAGISLMHSLLMISRWPFNDNRIGVQLKALRYDDFVVSRENNAEAEGIGDITRLPAYQKWLNNNLSSKARVLIVGDAQVFDIEIPILYSTCFDVSPLESATIGRNAEEQRAKLLELGVTHLVIHWAEMNRYRSPGNYGFSSYVDRALIDQMEANGVLRRVAWPIESVIADLYEVGAALPRE